MFQSRDLNVSSLAVPMPRPTGWQLRESLERQQKQLGSIRKTKVRLLQLALRREAAETMVREQAERARRVDFVRREGTRVAAELVRAAVCIQAAVRGRICRKRYEKVRREEKTGFSCWRRRTRRKRPSCSVCS